MGYAGADLPNWVWVAYDVATYGFYCLIAWVFFRIGRYYGRKGGE